MRILLSNDDGFGAQGLVALEQVLNKKHEVYVFAPEGDSSGRSSALTLDRPIQLRQHSAHQWSANGTPADAVHLAVNGYLAEKPDLVISGINHGANLGDDVMYSGTVGAAMEGRFCARLCIAASLVGKQYFDDAARWLAEWLEQIDSWYQPGMKVLNINIPDVPFGQIKGYQFTSLGYRHVGDNILPGQDPRGRECFWIGPAGQGQGEDFEAVANQYVSISPIHPDMTDRALLEQIKKSCNE